MSILKIGEHTQEYELLYVIEPAVFNKNDIILCTSEYIYFFNQDSEKDSRVVGFNLNADNISPIVINNQEIPQIVNVYGVDKNSNICYIFKNNGVEKV